MIPTGNVREYLIQRACCSYLQQFTDLLTEILGDRKLRRLEIDSFLMPDRNNKAPAVVGVRLDGDSNLALRMKINIPEVRMPISVPVANLEHSRMCPSYVNDQRHAYANDERFGFSPMSSLVCFLPIRSPSCLRTFFHPNTTSRRLLSRARLGALLFAVLTETGTLSTAGENHPLDIGDTGVLRQTGVRLRMTWRRIEL